LENSYNDDQVDVDWWMSNVCLGSGGQVQGSESAGDWWTSDVCLCRLDLGSDGLVRGYKSDGDWWMNDVCIFG
jgi:hypothetical protein